MLSLRLRTLNATWVNPRSDIVSRSLAKLWEHSVLILSRGWRPYAALSTRPDYIPLAGLCKGPPASRRKRKRKRPPGAAAASKGVLADAARGVGREPY